MNERQPGQEGDGPLRTGRGSTRIGDKAVSKIAGATAGEVEGVLIGGSATRNAAGRLFESVIGSQGWTRGVSAEVGEIETAIDLTMGIEYGKNIPRTLGKVRDEVTERVEDLTGLRVKELNVTVTDVVSTGGEKRREEERGRGTPGSGGEPGDGRRPRVRLTSELRITSEAKGYTSTNRGATEMSDEYGREEARRLSEERSGGGETRIRRSYRPGDASEASDRGSVQDRQNEEGGNRPSGTYGSSVDSSNIVGAAVAELIGTFILIFTGCAVAVASILGRSTTDPGAFYDSLAVALAFGLALVVVVAAIGHVSGAHVNPAVTLALAVTKKFSWQYVPIYVAAQLVGALLGAVAVWALYGEAGREIALAAATIPVEGVGDLRALLAEILVTFVLVFTIISVATDDRAPAGVAPLAVGFALACGVLIAGPVTGGSLNPARTLGPMIVAFDFSAVWVYIVGPIVGAVLAALVYDRFASRADASG